MTDLYTLLASPAPTGVIYQSRHDLPDHALAGPRAWHGQQLHAHTPGVRCPAPDCRWALPVYGPAAQLAEARQLVEEARDAARRAEVQARRAAVDMAIAVSVAVVAVFVSGCVLAAWLIFGGR
jgi:hypothetical protein